ncbi:MAG: DUF1552 domain-containing protein, partial [Planctomycetales bacterium]|nr:DUF1552 domain-containing protein [Planctomycetales bacterium]
AATKTRFGSLQFGVDVRHTADPWTRWSYDGPNRPVAPVDDPYQMFAKLYGSVKDRQVIESVLGDLTGDLSAVRDRLSGEDRRLLEQHASFVKAMQQDLAAAAQQKAARDVPQLPPGVKGDNDDIPELAKMQIELLVSSFVNDATRIATLMFTNSVGQARMTWLGVDETHHTLSHEPDSNADAQAKLTKINTWFAEQLAFLAKRLAETPDPSGRGSLLDNTTVIWANELGKGNSHTLDDIPFVLLGKGLDFHMGRALQLGGVPHNRLLLAIAHAMGHKIETFGNPRLCAGGPLTEVV